MAQVSAWQAPNGQQTQPRCTHTNCENAKRKILSKPRGRGENRGELGDYPEGSSTVPGSTVPLFPVPCSSVCSLSKLFARFDSASALALASASNALRDFLFWIFNYPSHTVNWFPLLLLPLAAPLLLAAPHQMLFCQLIDCASRQQQQQQQQ